MEKVTEIVQKALHREDMQLRDIPQIDLYMDQVLTLFSQHGGDNMLTKTMINNYRKEDIIRPLAGKKYTKNHIIQMLLIYFGGSMFRVAGLQFKELVSILLLALTVVPVDMLRKLLVRAARRRSARN